MQEGQGPAPSGGVIRTFLIADVRGYTVFTSTHGDEAAAELAARFASLAEEVVAAGGGRVIELRGDEALAVFESARQAIRSAVELQRRFVDETIADPSRPLAVGIGLDAGEAVPVGDGYRGGALNLAARLCSVAGPGEIYASREVAHLARRVDGIAFVDRGTMSLKGLEVPVPVVRVHAEPHDPADDAAFREALGVRAPTPKANPYKGLHAFEEADAEDFFGREALVERLLDRLRDSRFVAVVGPSGSGKSSVVRAGLIPALRGGAIDGSERWRIAEMFPGAHPLEELEAALLRTADASTSSLIETLERDEHGLLRAIKRIAPEDGSDVLLFVDQFEEVFTLVEDEWPRSLFLGGLRAALADPRGRLRVVIALRADFYDRPLQYLSFGDLLRSRVEPVLPLAPAELERAITGPAERADARLEDGLVAEMLSDVADEPGALPLLQYALTELFERRSGNVLTREVYRSLGGVAGALGRRAEELYAALDDFGRAAAEQLFLRLVAIGEGAEDTRRPVTRAELESLDVDAGAMNAVVDAFGTSRLLSFDRDARTGAATVQIAHEAMLSAWDRLGGWIDDARDDLATQRRVAVATREWADANEDASFLARGALLERFEAWLRDARMSMTRDERRFLDTSIAERDRRAGEEASRAAHERELERRSTGRLRALVVVLAVATLGAIAITAFALAQRSDAERERRTAVARELAAASLASVGDDPERATLLALEAIERTRAADGSVLPEAEEALHRAVTSSRLVRSVRGVGGRLDWSVDGRFAAQSAGDARTIDVRDGQTGDRIRSWQADDVDISGVAFSPDGSLLATTGRDTPTLGTVTTGTRGALKIWDPSSGTLRFEVGGIRLAWSPSFSADGSVVAASWPSERVVRVVDVATGRVIASIASPSGALEIALDPAGDRVAVTAFDGSVLVYDVATGDLVESLTGHDLSTRAVAWSPDGRWIATASDDATARIWDASDGSTFDELDGHADAVTSLDWSSDSRRLVTSSADGTAKVWGLDDAGARAVMTLPTSTRGDTYAAISPDGTRVITSDPSRTAIRVWDATPAGDAEWANLPTVGASPSVAFLPDGRLIASGEHGSATVWGVDAARRVATIGPGTGTRPASVIDVTDDGRRVALAPPVATQVSAWDVATGEQIYDAPLVDEVAVKHLATTIGWDPNGTHLAAGTLDGEVWVFGESGAPIRIHAIGLATAVTGVGFAGDGDTVVASGVRETPSGSVLEFWDWSADRVERTLEFTGTINAIDVSPDGDRVAVALGDGSIVVVDVATGQQLERFASNSGSVLDLAFSPNGSRIATGGGDGTVRLFDAMTGAAQLVLRAHTNLVSSVAFSADGTRLASASADGLARVWALDLDDLISLARQQVTRALSDAECHRYLNGPCSASA